MVVVGDGGLFRWISLNFGVKHACFCAVFVLNE